MTRWERRSTGNCARYLDFEYTNEWYIYNLESVLQNEAHKILIDFEIKTD